MIAKKLKKGSHVRVIAPSTSFKVISDETRKIAHERFEELGLKVSYGTYADEWGDFGSGSIEKRLADLHNAFKDKSVDAIFTAIGGKNSVQLVDKIDYDLIKENPKILCGLSDITALLEAVHAKTGLVTYYGPHFSSFGMRDGFEYTLKFFEKCLMNDEVYEIWPASEWSDDLWFIDQDKREFMKNDGYWVINEGSRKVKGKLVGGNLGTLQLLQGTSWWPGLKNKIVFVEDTGASKAADFDRDLQSLILQKDFESVKALVIGRFQKESEINLEVLQKIIKNKPELKDLCVIANVDFGHATPILTLPIGGEIEIEDGKIKVLSH